MFFVHKRSIDWQASIISFTIFAYKECPRVEINIGRNKALFVLSSGVGRGILVTRFLVIIPIVASNTGVAHSVKAKPLLDRFLGIWGSRSLILFPGILDAQQARKLRCYLLAMSES